MIRLFFKYFPTVFAVIVFLILPLVPLNLPGIVSQYNEFLATLRASMIQWVMGFLLGPFEAVQFLIAVQSGNLFAAFTWLLVGIPLTLIIFFFNYLLVRLHSPE